MIRLFAVTVWLAALRAPAAGGAYDPLDRPGATIPAPVDLTVADASRHRDIPIRVFLPPMPRGRDPVVLFSHGLGGNREGSRFLGEHWAARGYCVVYVQHPGSDDSVWKDKPLASRMPSMTEAASLQNLLLRVKDVSAVLDRLAAWNGEASGPLAGRLDMGHVGMSGHSFGAVTTQAVSGQSYAKAGPRFLDRRIRAAIAFSPSTPRFGNAADVFGSVRIPWMLMTGTRDVAPIGGADVASRLGVYPALQGIPKYEVVLENAEHSVFTDRPLPGDRQARNPNHHRVILALSSAFWDAHLRDDARARAWLAGPGPRGVMEAGDRWQFQVP